MRERERREGEEDEVKEMKHCVSVLTHSESSPKSRLFGAKQQVNRERHEPGIGWRVWLGIGRKEGRTVGWLRSEHDAAVLSSFPHPFK